MSGRRVIAHRIQYSGTRAERKVAICLRVFLLQRKWLLVPKAIWPNFRNALAQGHVQLAVRPTGASAGRGPESRVPPGAAKSHPVERTRGMGSDEDWP